VGRHWFINNFCYQNKNKNKKKRKITKREKKTTEKREKSKENSRKTFSYIKEQDWEISIQSHLPMSLP
jgi:hypothetical protein